MENPWYLMKYFFLYCEGTRPLDDLQICNGLSNIAKWETHSVHSNFENIVLGFAIHFVLYSLPIYSYFKLVLLRCVRNQSNIWPNAFYALLVIHFL